ncbi:MAG: hypothetical protein JXB50_13305 [Spirochaetes bacterium]|nr:hypothetical protein [Spirochaetota bacterium]
MDIVTLIIQAICGGVGGNVTGKLFNKIDLGVVWNSILGIVGGGLGGQILNQLGVPITSLGSSMDIPSLLSNIGSGAVGGGVLMVIVGLIKNMIAKK